MPETPSTHTKPSKRRRRPRQRHRVTLASIINGWWERLFSAKSNGRPLWPKSNLKSDFTADRTGGSQRERR